MPNAAPASPKRIAPGAGLFRSFRTNNKLSQDQAGKQLGGFSAPSVHAWEVGASRPKNHTRKRIAVWTQGAVPEDSWMFPDEVVDQAPFQKPVNGAA